MSCGDSTYIACNDGLPAGFCCPPTSTCLHLAQNTTLLCCPNSDNCSIIEPISCDITEQNATLHPGSTLKTTILDTALSTCGNITCCPFGYTCKTVGTRTTCDLSAGQDAVALGLVTLTSSSSAIPSSTSTSLSSTNPTNSPAANNRQRSSALGIAITFSLLAICLILGLVFWLWRKRRSKAARKVQERFDKAELPAEDRRRSVGVELDGESREWDLPGRLEVVELPATPLILRDGSRRNNLF